VSATHSLFVTAPRGLVDLLADELRTLGARVAREQPGGVRVRGPLSFGYRICLWSRLANRVLLHLADFPAADADALYEGARAIAWEDHVDPDGTIAVDFVAVDGAVGHALFGAQRVKDAVVDRLRDRFGRRPSVDTADPWLRINVHHRGRGASVAIDLSGDSLHRRGWRVAPGSAPLKENLAAAMLARGGWAELVAHGGGLVDPMCGAGTIVIEAAQHALDVAPGSLRERFGFTRWRGHDEAVWSRLVAEAAERALAGSSRPLGPIVGLDHDRIAVSRAREHAQRARIGERVRFEHGVLANVRAPDVATGLFATNPPYGERLADRAELPRIFAEIGAALRGPFARWPAIVLAPDDPVAAAIGLAPSSADAVDNGPLQCRMLRFAARTDAADGAADGAAASPFANRLRKNARHLGRWAAREGLECWRVYDADIPEYNVAVDRYGEWTVVQEYEAPRSIDPTVAAGHLAEIVAAIPDVLGVAADRVVLKRRKRQRGRGQYDELEAERRWLEVQERGHRFVVDVAGRIDTGLFLDHRGVRRLVAELAPGRDFLNLFGYTAAATVYAAKAGARATTTVDLSAANLEHARRNFDANAISGPAHELVRDDAREYLAHSRRRWDLVLVDAPTYSTSKRAPRDFDVQRDHVELLVAVAARMVPAGAILFSTHARTFALDEAALADLGPREITRRTTQPDFARSQGHRAWLLTVPAAAPPAAPRQGNR
jgi:23S rRNA (guanine2445-N2)-methyltransferase / 23S rRNA (guanine2069-N7)-methyltransferase